MSSSGIRTRKTGTFDVRFSAYCGMSYDVGTDLDRDAAKAAVRAFLTGARKKGHPVNKLGKGTWEVETPEDAAMVGDGEGTLTVRPRVERFRVILGRKIRMN